MSISLQRNLAIQIQVTRRPREINLCLLTSCCFPNQQDHKNIIGDFYKGTESTGCLVFLVSLSGVVVTSQCGGPNSYQKWSGRMITLSNIYIYKLMIIIGCTCIFCLTLTCHYDIFFFKRANWRSIFWTAIPPLHINLFTPASSISNTKHDCSGMLRSKTDKHYEKKVDVERRCFLCACHGTFRHISSCLGV